MTLPRLCKYSSCQLFSVQVAYSADAIWFEAVCAYWEKERARAVIHSCCLWNYVSHKVFKLLYKLFNEEIWIVPHLQHWNYFTRARLRLTRCRCMSCQTSHGRRVISLRFLRSAFLETTDQTSPSDYRPIVIGSRSIGAPLVLLYDFISNLVEGTRRTYKVPKPFTDMSACRVCLPCLLRRQRQQTGKLGQL